MLGPDSRRRSKRSAKSSTIPPLETNAPPLWRRVWCDLPILFRAVVRQAASNQGWFHCLPGLL